MPKKNVKENIKEINKEFKFHKINPIQHENKKYKFVNQKTIDGVTYTAYRYRIRKQPDVKTIVVIGDKTKVVKDLKTYWNNLK